MATYKLDIDVSNIVSKYRNALKDMQAAGAKDNIVEGLTKQLDQLEQKFNELSASGKAGFVNSKDISNFVNQVQKAYSKLSNLGTKMNSSIDSEGFLSGGKLNTIRGNIKKIKGDINDLKSAAKESFSSMGFNDAQIKSIVNAKNKIGTLNNAIEKTRTKLESLKSDAQVAYEKISGPAEESFLKSANSAIGRPRKIEWTEETAKSGQGSSKVAQLKADLRDAFESSNSFKDLWEKIGAQVNDIFIPTKADSIKARLEELFELAQSKVQVASNDLDQATKALDNFNEAASTENVSNLIQIMDKQEKQTQALKEETKKEEQAIEEDNRAKQNLKVTTENLSTATLEAANAERQQGQEIINSAKNAEEANKEFSQLFNTLTQMFSITAVFATLRKIIRSTFEDIKELDQAYASIAYVTNETVGELWSTYDEYSAMAEKLGQSTVDVIKASAIYRQQGLDTAEALELTTDTMKLATIAGNDYSKATQEMTAALRGFKMEMDEGAHVSDVYSELAAHAAASVDGIAQAMSRTASIANSAGMSFENTSAFLTQMIETTQESAENIGTSMKTIIARFTELKTNVAGTSESEFSDLDFNKVDAALKSVGVSLKDAHGQFRNLDEVFLELSAKWDTLDRNTQRYIATIAAGSRQQSRFIAMMDNYERTAELIDIAQDSAGKAEEQFSKAVDTIGFKLNTLKTNWEEFKLSFTSSDFVKGLIDELGIAVNSLKDSNKLALGIAIPFAIVFVKGFIEQVKKTAQANVNAYSSIGKIISDAINNKINIRFNDKIKKEIEKVEQEINKVKKDLNKEGWIQILSKEEEKKISDIKRVFQNFQLDRGQNNRIMDSMISDKTIKLDEVREKLKEIGLDEKQIELIIEEINGKMVSEVLPDLLDAQNIVDANKKELEDLDNKLKKLTSTTSQWTQALAEGAGPGVTEGFQTLANSAGLVVSMLVGGADAAQTMKVAFASLATQSVNLGMSLLSSGANVIASTIKQKQAFEQLGLQHTNMTTKEIMENTLLGESEKKVALEAQKAAMSAKTALISTGIGALIVAIGTLLAYIIQIGVETAKNRKTEEELHEIRLQNLQEQAQKLKDTVKTQEEEVKNADELMKKYDELSSKTALTIDEQKEYNELIEEIQDQFPEIVNGYDEAGEKVRIQRDYWEQIVNLQKQTLNYNKQNQKYINANIAEEKIYTIEHKYSNDMELNTQVQNLVDQIKNDKINKEEFKKILKDYNLTTESFGQNIGQVLDDQDFVSIKETIKNKSDSIKTELEEQKKIMQRQYEQDKLFQEQIQRQSIVDAVQLDTDKNEATASIAVEYAQNQLQKDTNSINDLYNDIPSYIANNAKIISGLENGNILSDLYSKIESSKYSYDQDSGFYYKGDYGYKVMYGEEDNIIEYTMLPEQLKEFLKSEGIGIKEWNEARFDDEKWKEYAALVSNWIEQYTVQKLAEAFDKIKLTDEESKELLGGNLTLNELEKKKEELIKAVGDDEIAKASIESYIDSIKDRSKQDIDIIGNFMHGEPEEDTFRYGKFTGEGYTQNELAKMADGFNALINAVGDIDKAKDLVNNYKNFKPEQIAEFFEQFNFEDVNALNADEMRQVGIDLIKKIFGVEDKEASDMYDDFGKKGGIDENKLSSGDINEFETRMKSIEDAYSKTAKIFNKSINGTGKLASSEISALSNAIDEINKVAPDKLNLSDYFNPKTGYIDRAKLKNDLIAAAGDFEDFEEKAIAAKQKELATGKISQEQYDTDIKSIKNIASLIPGITYQIQLATGALTDARSVLDDIENMTSAVSNAVSQYISDGFISAKSLQSLREDKLFGEEFINNTYKYVNDQMQLNIQTIYEYVKAKIAELKATKAMTDADREELYELMALEKEFDNKIKEQTDQIIDKEKELTDARKAHADAIKDVADKQKALNEAVADYNELIYGSSNRKSTLDPLYNYQQAISYLNDEISRRKELLEDSEGFEEASENLNKYLNAAHYQLVEYQAENKILEEGLAIRRNNLLNGSVSYQGINVKFSDYVKIDEKTGLAAIDQQLIQNAKFADKWKDQIESFVDDYNKYSQELLKNQDAVRKAEKEIQQLRMDATKKWADFEKNIAETLKNEYEEEVNALKEKYDSMKNADDDYIDALQEAINKQRKLRDRENQWEQLAQKEKKLSLLRRDTSGANAMATKKLEKEIEQDREKMLDDKIDDVIENIQKLSEKQDELRQTEIELKEALLDDALYWNMTAETVAQSFTSVDEFLSWSVKHNKEYLEMTEQQRQEFLDSETKKFNESIGAMAILTRDEIDSIENQIEVTAEEINTTVQNTGEVFTTEVSRVINETSAELNKEITNAQNKIQSAIQALVDANEKLREASQKVDEIAAKLAGLSYSGGSYATTSTPAIDYGNTSATYAEQVGTGQTVGQHQIEQRKIESAFNNFKNLIASNRGTDNYLKSIQGDYATVSTPGLMGAELEELAKLITSNYKSFSNHILVDTQSDDLKIYKNGVPLDPFYTWNPKFKIYKNGGLVNYTGPAWVDGTSNTPEAFLSAEDTERIGNAAKLLSNVPALNHSNISTTNSSYGDTNIEINLNIDHVSSDVDIEEMLDRVKQEIVDIARPTGTNVILHQQI